MSSPHPLLSSCLTSDHNRYTAILLSALIALLHPLIYSRMYRLKLPPSALGWNASKSLTLWLQMMDEMEDYDELIGPAPPELLDEIEAAGDDDRAKEVVRILR